MQMNLVLVDTCIWAPFFSRPHSAEKIAVDVLLDDNRVALIGPILAEVLSGFRREPEADWVASRLKGIHYIELIWEDWRESARLSRRLAAQGHELPLTDLVIASVALRTGYCVYSSDPHFALIEGLLRFTPPQ